MLVHLVLSDITHHTHYFTPTTTHHTMIFTDTMCLEFFDNNYDKVEEMGGPDALTKEQQRMYIYGEELFTDLVQSVREM